MKNLTAHYNIYYNASEMLKASELNFINANRDDFNNRLEIFPIPNKETSETEVENLNEVTMRANRIALEKYESNWVDDAFLLLAKAEYYKGNFFTAAEYFSYVSQNFPFEKGNSVEALVWHGKSLFALKKYKDADSVLQLAYSKNQKYYRAELNAALAESYLHQQNKLSDAAYHLQKAVDFSKERYSKIRWTYILAQIQEENNNPEAAYNSYTRVARSNASFEMSFNANLAQVRLKEAASGIQFDKVATLKRLLKEDKNKEFKDQIYYQIGLAHEGKDLDEAINYYNISAHTEPGSEKQKALSYLRLAELNFDSLKNYSKAQLYYDSTLQFLPQNYPYFTQVSLKAQNLQYLADRLMLIEKERELLMLGDLSEEDRTRYVEDKIKEVKSEEIPATGQTASVPAFTNISNTGQDKVNETFYFNNPTAVSRGLTEFRKRWGNRKLTDNWRISSGVTNTSIDQNPNASDPFIQAQNTASKRDNIDSLRKSLLNLVPTSPEGRELSLSKIKNAQYEIAMFYKDRLNDYEAAIDELEESLKDYTLNESKVAELYYQLYRLYEDIDPLKSETYRELIIQHFPQSVYAKTLINPDFGRETETLILQLEKQYEAAYITFNNRKYTETLSQIKNLESQAESYPDKAAKFEYLKALAIGHTEKAPAFINSLENLLKKYPNDTTVTPLVRNQLAFIEHNKSMFYNRSTALLNYDPNEIIPSSAVVAKKSNPAASEENTLSKTENITKTENKSSSKDESAQPDHTATLEETAVPKVSEKPKTVNFSNNIRIKHAVVIDIKNATINVAKPFAALTKHFYTKFAPGSVNLSIRMVGNTDKLIIVKGPFTNRDMAEKALEELSAQLPEILELKDDEFKTFIISDPNLLLINNTESLNQYLNFIK